ncbi:hypothetical protein BDN70DRAFT_936279 [Pholiota conissans]|uniref:Uncharacterized protein n=1 Tax=Pholiota conissans TaxID=109636 RepID=A0A9P5YT11_9AGAR|nr:hypothetical protein BDN70DRAFT_936279 [Pholiota conissans]
MKFSTFSLAILVAFTSQVLASPSPQGSPFRHLCGPSGPDYLECPGGFHCCPSPTVAPPMGLCIDVGTPCS